MGRYGKQYIKSWEKTWHMRGTCGEIMGRYGTQTGIEKNMLRNWRNMWGRSSNDLSKEETKKSNPLYVYIYIGKSWEILYP